MASLRKCTQATVLSILFFSAHAASIPSVFKRQETCAAENFSPCGGSGLPASFCCEKGKTCIPLAGNTTVLCCPAGISCDRITPINCAVSLQDPEAHPEAVIKTTALKSKLPACGTQCCPFGYTCNGADQCVINVDQTKKPSELPASELPATTPGPTSSVPIPTVIPTTIATTTPLKTESSVATAPAQQDGEEGEKKDPNKNESTFPTAIVIGVLCGVLAGVGLGVALLLFLARRRRRNTAIRTEKKRSGGPRPSTSTSSFGNIISEPIPISDSALRTDFILKTPSTVHSRNSSAATTLAAQPIGLARSDSKPRTPERTPERGIPVPPIRNMRPNSGRRPPGAQNPLLAPPGQHLQHEPSSESINVFADPHTVGRPGQKRLTSATTFTDLMDEAELGDVRRGKPFVPRTPQMPSPLRK
ncbi:uncharacterized protein CTRU02_205631 [Colletotrichum truncatum]|uniref:Uncharacterized protein n=1 Tax=Colletotrichum truncatum TaxID=5467 RepID=A0ACC3Z4K0_COLTU|nr:uncharacterized protein CTRU02_09384 [Colletotrichum truncatum]KAF6788576.1 hypothetical protein CTRU02_09384 [Colletotrichum truncatum]